MDFYMMMNLDSVKKLCVELGEVRKWNENAKVFGNLELEIQTPRKTVLNIIADRGEFLCYIKKKTIFREKWIPLDQIIKGTNNMHFESLESIIEYLKTHIREIENES